MNLLAIKARNWLGLEAVEIQPSGPVTEISGANGAGKSATLSAFVCALTGKESIPVDPVRHGADEAEIDVTFDELRIRLVVQPDRSTKLVVTNAEGFTASKPQAMLNGLYSKLIDPVEFSHMKPAEQRALVAELVGLSGMLDELARADESDRANRRDVNRDLKAAEARLAAMPDVAAVEPVDVSATLAEIRAAREHNQEVAARVRDVEQVREAIERERRDIVESHAAIARLRAEIAEIEESIVSLERSIAEAEQILATTVIPESVDLFPLERRLEDAEAINAQHRQYVERDALHQSVTELAGESQRYTDALTQREAERRAVIEAADLPIEGLGFGDDCLTYKGKRLDNISTAESICVCTAIAMAMSPKIKVLLVKDWSLLDSKSRAMVTEMAQTKGYMVLAEVVDESGEVGFYIEDGRVAAVHGVPVEPTGEVSA